MGSLFDKFLNRFFSNEESIYFAILLFFSFLFIIFFWRCSIASDYKYCHCFFIKRIDENLG